MINRDVDADSSGDESTLPPARRFEVLSHEHRLSLVATLRERSGPVELDTLAERIAEAEPAEGRNSGSSGRPDRTTAGPLGESMDRHDAVYCSLYHRHVPKLSAADVVVYDPDTDAVRPDRHFEAVADLADSLPEADGSDAEPAVRFP